MHSNESLGTTRALIPVYTVADLTGPYSVGPHWRVQGGVAHLDNPRYASRVFIVGAQLEPALARQFYLRLRYRL